MRESVLRVWEAGECVRVGEDMNVDQIDFFEWNNETYNGSEQ